MRKKYLMASWKENHIFSENIKLLTIYIGGSATHESSHNINSLVNRAEQRIVSWDSFLETVTPYVFHGLKKREEDLVTWQRRSLTYIPTVT